MDLTKLKYGILIAVVPSKSTPAIARAVASLVAEGAKLIVILGDVVALPAVIANPVPTVILFVRLKYGISILPLPSKPTPFILLAVVNFVAVLAVPAEVAVVALPVVLNLVSSAESV